MYKIISKLIPAQKVTVSLTRLEYEIKHLPITIPVKLFTLTVYTIYHKNSDRQA